MGDYTKTGVKIGTCGDAYYATLKMLEAEATTQADPEIEHYINPAKGCRFAFPFPEYEGKGLGEISNFHEGQRAEFTFEFETEESAHKEITTHLHPKGAPGINIFTPCPFSEGARVSRNLNKDKKIFRLVGQCYQAGELLLTAECVYCGCLNVFTSEESLQLAEQLRKQAEHALNAAKRSTDEHTKKQENDFAEYRQHIVKEIIAMVDRNTVKA